MRKNSTKGYSVKRFSINENKARKGNKERKCHKCKFNVLFHKNKFLGNKKKFRIYRNFVKVVNSVSR